MRAKHIPLLMIVAVLVSVLTTVGGLLYRQIIEYADFEADRFGFPFYWIEHVKATFAGRTDHWNIETSNLAVNIVLFFMVSFAILSLILVWKTKRSQLESIEHSVVLYLNKELASKMRELGFNFSKTFENHFKHLLTQFHAVSTRNNSESTNRSSLWWGCPDLNRGLESPSLQA